MKRHRTLSRRTFLASAGLAAGVTVIPSRPVWAQGQSAATSYAANEKLNIAGIGVGGRGGAHVEPVAGREPGGRLRRGRGHARRLPAARREALQGPERRQAAAQAVHRLPRDARQDGQPDRRGVRRHARPPPRPGLDDGHEARQARLLREAADAQHRRGPAADPGRPRAQGGHADGQPGPGRARAGGCCAR